MHAADVRHTPVRAHRFPQPGMIAEPQRPVQFGELPELNGVTPAANQAIRPHREPRAPARTRRAVAHPLSRPADESHRYT